MSKKIVTHSGTFHADESLAVFMLRTLPEFSSSVLVRTRDPLEIAKGDIVVDVGGEYSPATNRFDHHQRGFIETFSPSYEIKLSSAGLVYKHFGKRVVAKLLGWEESNELLEGVFQKVYLDLILMFDGVDNGVQQYQGSAKYYDGTSISSRVSRLNPRWNLPTSDEILDRQFELAVKIVGEELVATVEHVVLSWLPARDIVLEALQNRFEADPSGSIIILSQYCPFKSHLFDLEGEENILGQVLYVMFEDTSGNWRLQAVPESPDSFSSRKALPEAWRGLRDLKLDEVSGVEGCTFIHASGFTGGAKTRAATLSLARLALK